MGTKKLFSTITLEAVHNFIPKANPVRTPMVRFATGIVKIEKIRRKWKRRPTHQELDAKECMMTREIKDHDRNNACN